MTTECICADQRRRDAETAIADAFEHRDPLAALLAAGLSGRESSACPIHATPTPTSSPSLALNASAAAVAAHLGLPAANHLEEPK